MFAIAKENIYDPLIELYEYLEVPEWLESAQSVCVAVKDFFVSIKASAVDYAHYCTLSEEDRYFHRELPRIKERWFPKMIPLSSQMGEKSFVIGCFQKHPKINELMKAFFGEKGVPANLSVDDFFNKHVFTLLFEEIRMVPNPEPQVAFWLPKQELEREIKTIVGHFLFPKENEIKEKHLEPIRSAYNKETAQSKDKEAEELKSDKEAIQQKYKADREKLYAKFQEDKVEAEASAQAEIEKEREEIHHRLFKQETTDSFAQDMGKFKAFIDARLER